MAEQPTDILKLVDEHGNLASIGEIDDFFRGLPENITVVSIIGPQNTGSDSIQRTQVLVEGSDSIQRMQDETTSFDYRFAFFALKISHVVLVNLDCRTVGQSNGGCVPLLRMIFLETIRQQMGKPRVVMTIRDCHNPEHPHDQDRAVRQMVEIWESMHGRRRNNGLHDFIEVSAELFPYFGCEEDFRRKCSDLRKRLTPDTLRQRHSPQENLNIAAATFSATIREIWTSIMNNEYLKVPSSNEHINKIMAERLMRQILDSEALTEEYTCPSDFNKKVDQYLQSIMVRYDADAEDLINRVKLQVKQETREKIIDELKSKFRDVLNTEREKRTKENKERICTELWNMKKGILSSIFKFTYVLKAFEDLQVDTLINPHIERFNDSFSTYICFDEYTELGNECKSRHKNDLKEYAEKEADRLQWKHQIFVGGGKVSLLILAGCTGYIGQKLVFNTAKSLIITFAIALRGIWPFASALNQFIDCLTHIYEEIILPAAKEAVGAAAPRYRQSLSVAMLGLLMKFNSKIDSFGT